MPSTKQILLLNLLTLFSLAHSTASASSLTPGDVAWDILDALSGPDIHVCSYTLPDCQGSNIGCVKLNTTPLFDTAAGAQNPGAWVSIPVPGPRAQSIMAHPPLTSELTLDLMAYTPGYKPDGSVAACSVWLESFWEGSKGCLTPKEGFDCWHLLRTPGK